MRVSTWQGSAANDGASAGLAGRIRGMLPSLVVNLVVPLLAYAVLRPLVGSDSIALAIGGALPAAWTIAWLAWRRTMTPIGVVSVLGFGVALLVTAASGGNPLLLKLHEAPLTGTLGLAGLISVAARRPLLATVLRWLGRAAPEESRRLTVATVIIGLTLLVDALTRLVLALTLPTATFLAVHRAASWAILGAGIALLLLSWGRVRPGTAQAPPTD